MFIVVRNGHFGDALMAGLFVAILNDQGISAVLDTDRTDARDLLRVPLWAGEAGHRYDWQYETLNCADGILASTLSDFASRFGLGTIAITRKAVPIRWRDDSARSFDVAMGTQTSDWTPYRNWPYFGELKAMLRDIGVSFVDMDEQRIYGEESLRIVSRAKIYLGLETGRSHLYSSVAAGKGIILQSGYSSEQFWSNYSFEFLSVGAKCAPCYLREGCQHGHCCMHLLSTERVFQAIVRRLHLVGEDKAAFPQLA
jgi:hypothetical protein